MFKRISKVTGAYILSLVLMIGFFLFKYNDLPPQLPLFYSLPESESQIVPMLYILLIPVVESLLLLSNIFLRSLWFKESLVMSTIMEWTNYTICLCMTYVFIKITLLVS